MAGYATNDATARMIANRAKESVDPKNQHHPQEYNNAWWNAARELRAEFEKEGLTSTVDAIDDLMERAK